MKKFVTLFTDSARELKSVRTITTMAMLAAVAVILGYFSIEYGQFIRIGFPVFLMVSLITCLGRLPEVCSPESLRSSSI